MADEVVTPPNTPPPAPPANPPVKTLTEAEHQTALEKARVEEKTKQFDTIEQLKKKTAELQNQLELTTKNLESVKAATAGGSVVDVPKLISEVTTNATKMAIERMESELTTPTERHQ